MSGELVVVATPIGNLGDVSTRARDALASADVICCEDTRRTRQLLSALSIRAAGRLVAVHEHNEAQRAVEIVGWVTDGKRVCLVSDAGTPAVSDPGSRVVAAVADAGLRVTTIPGPSSAIAALTVSGLGTDRFCVEGFLPRRGPARRAILAALGTDPRTVVIFESPQRVAATLRELADSLGDRRAVVARELTKLHEEILRGTLSQLADRLIDTEVRGEIVVVVEGAEEMAEATDETILAALADERAAGASVRDAATRVATSLAASHRRVYELALMSRREAND